MCSLALDCPLALSEGCSDILHKAESRPVRLPLPSPRSVPGHRRLAVSREMGQEARGQRGSRCTQPTPGRLGRRGGEGRGVGEPRSGGWMPAGLRLFISQGVTVVCPAAEEPTHVCGTEVSFVRVPWHLTAGVQGCKKIGGGRCTRGSCPCTGRHPRVTLQRRKWSHLQVCIQNGYKGHL